MGFSSQHRRQARKGQVEIIIVFGLILVGVVAIYYAYTNGLVAPSPPSIKEDQDIVRDSVENLIRQGGAQTIKEIGMNGGYLQTPENTVSFLGSQVPYWQMNGDTDVPDMHAAFLQGMQAFMEENKGLIEESYKDKNVSVSNPQVTAAFFPESIRITVVMPTTVRGYAIHEPYVVELSTRFEQAYRFSKAFAEKSVQERYLEYFTLSTMIYESMRNDPPKLPFAYVLTSCDDEPYFTTKWDIEPFVLRSIKIALANTYLPGQYPTGLEFRSSYPKYTLPDFQGEEYPGLNLTFFLPDDFSLDGLSYDQSPEFISLIPKPIEYTGACMSNPVSVDYYLSYPAVVVVNDPLTGSRLQFATQVFIKGNEPGEWGDQESLPTNELCSDPGCSADITVTSGGQPVQGAGISFMGCGLGTTGAGGRLNVPVPCGSGVLEAYKTGYSQYSAMLSTSNSAGSNELEGLEVEMLARPDMDVHLYEAVVTRLAGQYMIGSDQVGALDTTADESAHVVFTASDGSTSERLFRSAAGRVTELEARDYTVTAGLFSPDFSDTYGAVLSEVGLEANTSDLYIYLPYTTGFQGLETEDMMKEMATMAKVLASCGLGPVSTEPASGFGGCIVDEEDVA